MAVVAAEAVAGVVAGEAAAEAANIEESKYETLNLEHFIRSF